MTSLDSVRSCRAAMAIARAIETTVFTDQWRSRVDVEPAAGELSDREAGVAVLFTELAWLTGDSHCADVARELLRLATRRCELTPLNCGLFSGATGTAWAINHARRRGLVDDRYGDDVDPC